MNDAVLIECKKCNEEFKVKKEKLEVHMEYPEHDPNVMYNVMASTFSPKKYFKAKCPSCDYINYIKE